MRARGRASDARHVQGVKASLVGETSIACRRLRGVLLDHPGPTSHYIKARDREGKVRMGQGQQRLRSVYRISAGRRIGVAY